MTYIYEVVKYDGSLPGKVLMQDKPGWRCNTFLHWHKELEFVYMIDGVLDAKISGENIQIKSGDFYFCNSEEIHITSAPDKDKVIKYIVVLLSNEFMRSFCDQIDRIQFKIKEESRGKISDMLRQLVSIMESGDEYKLLKVNAVFMNIYHLLLTECAVEKKNLLPINMPDNFAYAKTIIEYIGCNYTENINLKDMADLVGLTSSYFSKYFKNITGTNFTQYLNSVRLEHALNEMLFKGQTVTKAAMNNGFPNVKSFIEICKKIYGCTPMEYKKQKIAEK